MNSPNETTNRTFSDMLSSLCQYQLQKEYDTTLSIFDGDCDTTPICAHHAKGRARLPLWKLVAVVGICAALWALLRGICSLFSLCSD